MAEKKCVCCDCGQTQDTMVRCVRCGSVRTVLLSMILDLVGPDWRVNFDDPSPVPEGGVLEAVETALGIPRNDVPEAP
jgi:hypothetical protein